MEQPVGKARPACSPFSLISLREQSSRRSLPGAHEQRNNARPGKRCVCGGETGGIRGRTTVRGSRAEETERGEGREGSKQHSLI